VVQTRANFDVLKPQCPVSLLPISTPIRSLDCEHLQVFDADSYVRANYAMSNVTKRFVQYDTL
jgi:hypothetical protein